MKRYQVIFTASSQQDIVDSYLWGVRKWGKRQARRWVRELRAVTKKQLEVVPRGFPLAPENGEEWADEIRQVIVGRYRLLFTIKRHKVYVLHVRGPYMKMKKRDSHSS